MPSTGSTTNPASVKAFISASDNGDVFRATIPGYDPLAASTRAGAGPNTAGPPLSTSLQFERAVAEIAFDWSRLTPIPKRPVTVHTLTVETEKTLRLIRADLFALGVENA
jgi:hypothetical protein